MILKVPVPVAKQLHLQALLLDLKELGRDEGQKMSPPCGQLRTTKIRIKVLVWWNAEIQNGNKFIEGPTIRKW